MCLHLPPHPLLQLAEEADVLHQSDQNKKVFQIFLIFLSPTGERLSSLCVKRSVRLWPSVWRLSITCDYFLYCHIWDHWLGSLFRQYLHEGAEGTASLDQLQGAELPHSQGEIPGIPGHFP